MQFYDIEDSTGDLMPPPDPEDLHGLQRRLVRAVQGLGFRV